MKESKQKKTFRFPFDIDRRIFIALAALFFILSIKPINELIFQRLSTKGLRAEITNSVNKQEQRFSSFSKSDNFLNRLLAKQLTEQELKSLGNELGISIYKDDSLISWTNERLITEFKPIKFNEQTAYSDQNVIGICEIKNVKINNETYLLKANIPLYINCYNENEYFKSRFNITFSQNKTEDDFGHFLDIWSDSLNYPPACKISFGPQANFVLKEKSNFLDVYDKTPWHFFFSALPFIFFGISIHTYLKVSVRRSPLLYFSLVLLTAFGIRLLGYLFGFPDNFAEFQLFNPDLYAGGSSRSSLGDVFINRCLIFWILLFFLINIQFRIKFLKEKKFKYLIAGLALTFLFWTAHQTIAIGRSLIFDSIINYDTTNFQNINFETIIGIFTYLIIFTNYALAIIITHRYLIRLTPIRGLRYLLVLVFPIISFFFLQPDLFEEIILLSGWTVLFFFLLDSKFFDTKFDFNSYKLLYWIIILAISCSLMFNYYVNQKDKQDKTFLAEQLFNFENKHHLDKTSELKALLTKDTLLKNLFSNYQIDAAKKLKNTLLIRNKTKLSSSHHIEIVLELKNEPNKLILEKVRQVKELLSYKTLIDEENKIYLDNSFGREKFIFEIANSDTKQELSSVLILIKRPVKDNPIATINSPSTTTNWTNAYRSDYQMGFYENGRLTNQMGGAKFPYKLNITKNKKTLTSQLPENTFVVFDKINDRNRFILVKGNVHYFYQISTTYAYIFSIIFLFISSYILGNIIARSNFRWSRFITLIGLTLRMRIHLSILTVELIAFIIIGLITIFFYRQRSENAIIKETLSTNFSIQSKISQSKILPEEISHKKLSYEKSILDDLYFDNYNNKFNIYSLSGNIIYASDIELVEQNIITKQINPLALYKIENATSENATLKESVGEYEYFSSYDYLRHPNGTPYAILHVPNLNSQSKLKKEISSFIISLVNIYTIIFLLSSIIAFFITRRLTRSFTTIVSQFSKINLTKTNKPLSWPYSDEIGLLVKEYNRTLLKLENSTMLLTKSEREAAWREMAKQIAHEIKNPLTPMTLSLQMLQRAIKKEDPNLREKTIRMTETVLEQIRVLTRIASNFSEFAKMSDVDARTESLREVIIAATGIYTDNDDAEFLFLLPSKDLTVYVDRVKIIRVITNIIQNGIQAVKEGEIAYITLTVTKNKTNLIRVSISDNGVGISKDLSKKIFEPNFTTKNSGSGLGLAMCKDIMIKTGGDISFETIAGEGTTFHLDIPIVDPTIDVAYNMKFDNF